MHLWKLQTARSCETGALPGGEPVFCETTLMPEDRNLSKRAENCRV